MVASRYLSNPLLLTSLTLPSSLQAEALEIENRLLRELNSRQEDQIGGLHREKDELRREMEWQSRDKKDVEDRVSNSNAYLQ